jgi:hypothetical protein
MPKAPVTPAAFKKSFRENLWNVSFIYLTSVKNLGRVRPSVPTRSPVRHRTASATISAAPEVSAIAAYKMDLDPSMLTTSLC